MDSWPLQWHSLMYWRPQMRRFQKRTPMRYSQRLSLNLRKVAQSSPFFLQPPSINLVNVRLLAVAECTNNLEQKQWFQVQRWRPDWPLLSLQTHFVLRQPAWHWHNSQIWRYKWRNQPEVSRPSLARRHRRRRTAWLRTERTRARGLQCCMACEFTVNSSSN